VKHQKKEGALQNFFARQKHTSKGSVYGRERGKFGPGRLKILQLNKGGMSLTISVQGIVLGVERRKDGVCERAPLNQWAAEPGANGWKGLLDKI